MEIKAKLSQILPLVSKPARYIGAEPNRAIYEPENTVADLVLAFPDVYELGMSHFGSRLLYQIINNEKDLFAERCYAPMQDMAEVMKKNNIQLYGLETYRPLKDFSAVGITLQTELNFTNVPYLLELGGIKAFRKDRDENSPFIIGGGPCTANPEPVADFFDFFIIGDAEELIVPVLRKIGTAEKKQIKKSETLLEISQIPGVYVPELLKTATTENGKVLPVKIDSSGPYKKAEGVKRVWVDSLPPGNHTSNFPQANIDLVHNRITVEVMRGCTHGCRFCQAGFWYRPCRERDADDTVDLAVKGLKKTGERELGLLSLSTADYTQFKPVTDYFLTHEDFKAVNVSVPSLRVDKIMDDFSARAKLLGSGSAATIAIETGSRRLRKTINKNISDEEILDAVDVMYKNNFRKIKVYCMVGLPGENLEDMEAFCILAKKMCDIGFKYNKRNTIHFNLGIFVPKPFTPFQWCEFIDETKAMEHINYVREQFRRNRKVRITWADWNLSSVENFYARGDRSLSSLIYKAYQQGEVLETFNEYFDFGRWENVWKDNNHDAVLDRKEKSVEEILPWDFIHAGVSRDFLQSEYSKALSPDGDITLDCKFGKCHNCGIPGNSKDIKLANPPSDKKTNSAPSQFGRKATPEGVEATFYKYRIEFSKSGLARFIPHHSMLTYIENVFRRLKIGMKYSKGFNPRPRIINYGILPLGLESKSEFLGIEVLEPLDTKTDWIGEISHCLPDGIELISITPSDLKAKFQTTAIEYSLEVPGEYLTKLDDWVSGELSETIDKKGRTIDLKQVVKEINSREGHLYLNVLANSSGCTPNPYLLFSSVTGIDEAEMHTLNVVKERQEIEC